MILIDEHVEPQLTEALEALKADPQISRCIYLSLGSPASNDVKEKLFELAQRHFTAIDAHIYLCGDGDIFILAPTIPSKDGKEFILSVVDYVKRPATDDWVGFYEVSIHINKLLAIVEQKLERIRKIEEAKRKLLEQQQQERKRQAILNGGTNGKSEDIKNRRTSRTKPELMMIEDDAFSRRLVENVLQKQYSLTGLGEASHALDTYARIAPDLLFLDINLPDVTGHELLEKILKLDPDAHVIMLSGNCDRENITHAMSRGAKGFIAKPFTREKLFQYIDRCPTIALKQRSGSTL
ncbi:MAG: response regulator [Alphaproteobacteria bacterium]|nr:response regulator [Alphaproteobacteria bacterium]